MKKLKDVEQLDNRGCTIACMASLVGMEYFQLRQFLAINDNKILYVNNKGRGRYGLIGVEEEEFVQVLEKLFGIKSHWIQFTSLRLLRKHCVLFINKIDNHTSEFHCAIFDASQRKMLQTSKSWILNSRLIARHKNTKTAMNDVGYNVHRCLEIQ